MWFFLRSLSSSFNSFSFIDCRLDHCEIIISHYLFSLKITMRWSWDDRRRERENCWEEKHRLNCAVSCVCFWIEKRMKIAKILRAVIEFRFKKRKLDVVFNDSKFDLFVLMNVICFADLLQSEMMLFSSKEMKEDFENVKHEFSNWFVDDVEIDEANWLEMSVANFDDDDFSSWRINRIEMIQKIVSLNWLKNCVEIDEKIRKWVAMNQCDNDEKKKRKEEDYKSVFEIFLSTTIIAIIIIIIIIINIIVIIIIEKNEYENCVNHLEDFDTLFICFVEFFASVSSLKKEDWEEVSKFECEENLKKEFVCVVCFFAEFSVLENVHFDCEFCDSILIFSLLSVFEFVASSIFSSTLENFASENQSFASFS